MKLENTCSSRYHYPFRKYKTINQKKTQKTMDYRYKQQASRLATITRSWEIVYLVKKKPKTIGGYLNGLFKRHSPTTINNQSPIL